MRFGHALLAGVLATFACSDGVGMPIREALETDRDPNADGGGRGGPVDGYRTCPDVADWPADFADSESDLIVMLNEVRMHGFVCNDRRIDPLGPLQTALELRCSARLHSVDMAINDFFRREGSDGSLPGERMEAAGFEHFDSGESIVKIDVSAPEAFQDVVYHSDNYTNACSNLAEREFTHIGVGRYQDYWTIDFAEERSPEGIPGP